jgi:hypothetical protein
MAIPFLIRLVCFIEDKMIQKACINRFEGEHAILLVDDKPLVFPKSLLPKNVKEADWLQIEIEGTRLMNAKIDSEEKAKTAKRIKEKLARLRR